MADYERNDDRALIKRDNALELKYKQRMLDEFLIQIKNHEAQIEHMKKVQIVDKELKVALLNKVVEELREEIAQLEGQQIVDGDVVQ